MLMPRDTLKSEGTNLFHNLDIHILLFVPFFILICAGFFCIPTVCRQAERVAKLEALKRTLSSWMESSAGVLREIEAVKNSK